MKVKTIKGQRVQIEHCNSTCVIHVRTIPYQHAMRLPFSAGWIGSCIDSNIHDPTQVSRDELWPK